IRDRSVVRSSVIPSAKYCCSGSLLRLAKGSTTMDRRGATRGCGMDVAIAATAVTGVGEGEGLVGHNHQAMTAMASIAAAAVAKDVAALGDDVAEIDADAKPDSSLVGRLGLAVDHPALHLSGATHCVDNARKFY